MENGKRKIIKMKLQTLIIMCVLTAAVSAQTVDVSRLPTIKVTGTAEIQVVPDMATFSFTVSKKNDLVTTAKKENDETIAKVTNVANRFGVAPTDVKTDYIRVKEAKKRVKLPNSDDDDDYEEIPDGYRVSRSLVIKLRDMTKFESFLTALLDAGINDVSNVVFSSSELRKYKNQARADAVRAAREKATAIAGEIRQTIGKAISIEEKDIDGYRSPYSNISSNSFSISDDDGDTETTAVGTISVKAQVEVKFLLN